MWGLLTAGCRLMLEMHCVTSCNPQRQQQQQQLLLLLMVVVVVVVVRLRL
jgi:hypothetical protein